ncbi:MAG: hypothetical protein GY804_09820 [Alphaproteobacteria bacterium]|nr:hypothetical protein [Alphaproteobacteria bacterium]
MAVMGKVTTRSGRLMAAVLGEGPGAIRDIKADGDPAVFTIGVGLPYAALIHDGGVRVVTEKMRRFFWAKYLTTPAGAADYNMWKALRYKPTIRYEPRPYLGSTVYTMIPEIDGILRKHGIRALDMEVKKIITGAQKATPL